MDNLIFVLRVLFFRSFNKLVGLRKSTLLSVRKSSYPYLACDSYACESTLIFSPQDRDSITSIANRETINSLYSSRDNIESLLSILTQLPTKIYANKLVVGDSDLDCSVNSLGKLKKYFGNIYATNAIEEDKENGIFGIPLGLENKSYRSSGLLRSYSKFPNFEVQTRPISILVGWNDKTFPNYRVEVRQILAVNRNSRVLSRRIPFQVVHNLTRRSLIVACPRGNGVDTHRIWESLYLGSLPVVSNQDFLPMYENWPIHCVESWSELSQISRAECEDLYLKYKDELKEVRVNSKKFLDSLNNE